MRDARLVLWLRGRQAYGVARYWLRAGFGVNPANNSTSERLYSVYLLLFAALWLPAMWLTLASASASIGLLVGVARRPLLLAALPGLVYLLQIGLMMAALRASPLKLTFADIAYVAGAPLPRAIVVLVGFLRVVVVRLPIVVLVAALIGVALTGATGAGAADAVGLRAGATALLLGLFAWALAWLVGAARLAYPRLRRCFVWLAPLLLLVLPAVIPEIVLWPGRVLEGAIRGREPGVGAALLAALAVLSLLALGWVGARVNLTVVADESLLYARLASLGMPGVRDRDLTRQVRTRAGFAPRRRRLRLAPWTGAGAPAARATLTYARHLTLLWPLARDTGLVVAGCLLLSGRAPTGGAYGLAQPWIAWLFLVVVLPPRGLLQAFRTDIDEPFLRQFAPVDNLWLLQADAAAPMAALMLVAVVVLLIVPGAPAATVTGLVFVPVLTLLLALCQGVSLVRVTAARIRLPYAWVAGVLCGLVMVAGVPGRSPLTALVIACGACVGLRRLIAAEGKPLN